MLILKRFQGIQGGMRMIIFKRSRWIFGLLAVGLMAASVQANELNDSIQLYFDGNFKAAHDQFTKLIDANKKDARAYYFRGLASMRLGDLAAADRDFATGAQLELGSKGSSVGQALQRVQGAPRLRLEKHRRMAKLSTRRRVQPVAPRPVMNSISTSPVTRDSEVKLTAGIDNTKTPTFRLASEVPLRRAQLPDLYADDPLGMLARERQPTGPTVVPSATKVVVPDAPVGSGLATTSASPQGEPAGLDDDPFALSDDNAEVYAPPTTAGGAGPRKGASVFGAVFRALRNATIPKFNTAGVLPGGEPPQEMAPSMQFPADAFPEEDPFEDPAADEAGDDPFSFDE